METAIFVLILIFGYALIALFRAVFPGKSPLSFKFRDWQINPVKIGIFFFLLGSMFYFMFTAHWIGFFLSILMLGLFAITTQL